MKAIMVMFDTLNRRLLPPYGCGWVHAPNFGRLARRTMTFDNCYAGSLPCMPSRREMHTGRYNFLHRSWGPLEPFDDSVPEILKKNGIYTHLVTDHYHYWEDGGATYQSRFSSYEFFRGQEGDAWKGEVADPSIPENALEGLKALKWSHWRQDWVNRKYLADESDHPQTLTFDAGLEFIETNKDADHWYLQIEGFDPHEPFFSYDTYRTHYGDGDYAGPHFDWPDYARVTETPDVVEHARDEYAALVTMCDNSLGRVLDAMDDHDLWDDTMLIVCTDHGFLLGEHGWWGKNVQPWYDETSHTPLFVWDPRTARAGERTDALVQTIDFGPTLLDFFGIERTRDMQGAPLAERVDEHTPRTAALFGVYGGHVSVTDGRYVYMRGCADPSNSPLTEYTLMPTAMRGFMPGPALQQATLVHGLEFAKGMPVLAVPGSSWSSPWPFGTLLYDLQADPDQEHPLDDDELELCMAVLLRDALIEADAPPEQFERLGLPAQGAVTPEHLLVHRQWPQVAASTAPLPHPGDFGAKASAVTTPLNELLDRPTTRAVLAAAMPALTDGPLADMVGTLTLLQLASMLPGALTAEALRSLSDALTSASRSA